MPASLQLRLPHPLRFSKGGLLERFAPGAFYSLCCGFYSMRYLFSKCKSVYLARFPFKRLPCDETPCANVHGIPPFEKREGRGSLNWSDARGKGGPARPT